VPETTLLGSTGQTWAPPPPRPPFACLNDASSLLETKIKVALFFALFFNLLLLERKQCNG